MDVGVEAALTPSCQRLTGSPVAFRATVAFVVCFFDAHFFPIGVARPKQILAAGLFQAIVGCGPVSLVPSLDHSSERNVTVELAFFGNSVRAEDPSLVQYQRRDWGGI